MYVGVCKKDSKIEEREEGLDRSGNNPLGFQRKNALK